MTSTPTPETANDAAEAFSRRLRHLSLSDTALLSVARRWRPGVVDARMVAITRDAATPGEIAAFPVVAAAYVRHTPPGRAARGASDVNVGRALRRRGPSDPSAARAIDRLTAATTVADLHEALLAAVTLIKGQPGPDWEGTAREVTAWVDPATRDDVRLAWARGFHTRPTNTAASATTSTEPAN